MAKPDPLRAHVLRLLEWEEAHTGFDKAIEGLSVEGLGSRAAGFEHSAWQLVEHMRLAQQDLLDFCVNPSYVHAMTWPDDYWPKAAAPPHADAWHASVEAFKADRMKLQELVRDESVNLFDLVPTGKGAQTYLRAMLLVADHNAYHLGQLVAVRRALGIWP